MVEGLSCATSATPTELTFSWDLPTTLGNEVVAYRVDVSRLGHREGTREVVQFDVDGLNTPMKVVTISEEIGMFDTLVTY